MISEIGELSQEWFRVGLLPPRWSWLVLVEVTAGAVDCLWERVNTSF